MIDRAFLSRMLAESFLTDIERELAKSHLEALDEIAKLRKMIVTMRDTVIAIHEDDLDAALEKIGEIAKLAL